MKSAFLAFFESVSGDGTAVDSQGTVINAMAHIRIVAVMCAFVVLRPLEGLARQAADASEPISQPVPAERDGQHDFDFEIGTWKSHVSRRLHPLTGSTTWAEYDGTTAVHKVWAGRANLVELEADGTAGHIEGLSLRLYDPQSHQWSLYFANSASGTMSVPSVGKFKNGRGEFYDRETLNGGAICVRFAISDITPNSVHFEQAFSADGGKTWEVNLRTTDIRVNPALQP